MNLSEDHLTFRARRSQTNRYRLLVWATLILAGLWLVVQVDKGAIEPLFAPTPTPTRSAASYTGQAKALFDAGDLDGAIAAFLEATRRDPASAQIWWEQAQTQAYSSALLTTDAQRVQRLQEALTSANRAIELAPESSTAHAIRAFVLDWNASYTPDPDERARMLNEASNEAEHALLLDPQNALALVYLAEVLLDQQSWSQAQQTIEEAVARDPSLMDAHRVHGAVLETLGLYRAAIEEYNKAAKITPNLTFLYIYIGLNYRRLEVYDRALEFFDRAAKINKQNEVEDPLPYIAIAKTYAQQGEFFIAARNAETAIEIDPSNANTYGQLGIIYVKSRNYEGALPVLKCAVYGCQANDNEVGAVAVTGLPLTSIEVAYYYLQYGSVLAALNQCAEAAPVLAQVETSFGSDPVIAEIIAENRAICVSFEK